MRKKQERKFWKYLEKEQYDDLPESFFNLTAKPSRELLKPVSTRKARAKKILALKRFQEFSGLTVTGRINKLTLEQVQKPHCSFPDVTTQELMSASLTLPRWNIRNISYCILNFTQRLPVIKTQQAIQRAFGVWRTQAFPFNFFPVSIDDGPMIVIRFVTGFHFDDKAFNGPDGDLAHAFPPVYPIAGLAGDIHFDDDESWGVPDLPSKYDLITVAIHEIGHALGLGHSPNKSSIMYRDYQKISHNLDNETITNIRKLYQGI